MRPCNDVGTEAMPGGGATPETGTGDHETFSPVKWPRPRRSAPSEQISFFPSGRPPRAIDNFLRSGSGFTIPAMPGR